MGVRLRSCSTSVGGSSGSSFRSGPSSSAWARKLSNRRPHCPLVVERTGGSASGSPCPARLHQSPSQWRRTSSGHCWTPSPGFPAQRLPPDAHGGGTTRCRFPPQGWGIQNEGPQNHCRTAPPPGARPFCCLAHCTTPISPARPSPGAPGALRLGCHPRYETETLLPGWSVPG